MIIDEIVASSQERASNLPDSFPGQCRIPVKLSDAIRDANRNPVIAEIKYASPSRGVMRTDTRTAIVAESLIQGGCCALSVLTEPTRFAGDTRTITAIRSAVPVPIIRKDFIVDPRQLDETKAIGADAVLLITSVLGDELEFFVSETKRRGIEPVVEVNSNKEARMALDTDATVTLVNNRNLRTFKTDLSTTKRISPVLRQAGRMVISASGFTWPCDIKFLKPFADGFLIGSSIMSSGDPRRKLEGFVYA